MLIALPAAAQQSSAEWDRCEGTGTGAAVPAEARIGYCTQLIESGRLSNEDLGSTYTNRANAYSDKGDHQRAMKDYDRALGLTPTDPVALNDRGDEYRILGQYDRALQDLNESLRLRPNHASTLFHRAQAYAGKGRYDLTIRDYDQVIGLTPKDADAYYNRSLAKRKTGDVAGANADLARAKQLDPNVDK